MFYMKIFPVTVLILTGHNVWAKNIPTEVQGDFDYDIDDTSSSFSKDYDALSDTKLVTVVVVRSSSPTSVQFETSDEYLLKKQLQHRLDDSSMKFNIFDYIDFDDENEAERMLEEKMDNDPLEMLRKKKKGKKKKKKNNTCKSACKIATKTVCKKFECTKKKKKSIAKSCYKKCKKDDDDD